MKPTPQKAAALLALHTAPLTRCRGGFRPLTGQQPVITIRTVNALADESLVELDDQQCPSTVTLTPAGKEMAEHIAAACAPKAGAA